MVYFHSPDKGLVLVPVHPSVITPVTPHSYHRLKLMITYIGVSTSSRNAKHTGIALRTRFPTDFLVTYHTSLVMKRVQFEIGKEKKICGANEASKRCIYGEQTSVERWMDG